MRVDVWPGSSLRLPDWARDHKITIIDYYLLFIIAYIKFRIDGILSSTKISLTIISTACTNQNRDYKDKKNIQ